MTFFNTSSGLVSYESDCSFDTASVSFLTETGQFSVSDQLCINPRSIYRIPSPGIVQNLLSSRHTTRFTTHISSAERATDTVSPATQDLVTKKQQSVRVTTIIDEFLCKERDTNVDFRALKDSVARMMSRIGYRNIQALPDEELKSRIRKVILIEKLSTTIDKTNESEVKTFDEAVRRRSFFR